MSQEHKKQELFGWDLQSWLASARFESTETDATLIYFGHGTDVKATLHALSSQLLPWQFKNINFDEGDFFTLSGPKGPIFLLRAKPLTVAQKRDGGMLTPSPYALARDLVGRSVSEFRRLKLGSVQIRFENSTTEEVKGALVGLEVGSYSYKSVGGTKPLPPLPQLYLDCDKSVLQDAQAIGVGVNIARHLVNTPPNILYPESFALQVGELFENQPGVSINVWDDEKLKRENMGLHLAVGSASNFKPCLLHIRYRPTHSQTQAPIAVVGKGVTFDSGGLDIKDPVGMRLMKKDMGGAAAIVGALHTLLASACDRPIDAYIPLAENAISGGSFRPGDIVRAKNGMSVEIHNTDAEGRLILADAMTVAATQDEKPEAIVVAATLTGAIKVGLGSEVAGYFSNDEELSAVIARQAKAQGDLMWRMPLFDGYRPRLETPVADINHCAVGSFGGAVTAALFLAEFAGGCPFAHMDIYAWADGEKGALREPGGSGQAVQCLVGVLRNYRF